MTVEGTIHYPGLHLFHEVGDHAGMCWCEPEIVGYDEFTDEYKFKHRKHQ